MTTPLHALTLSHWSETPVEALRPVVPEAQPVNWKPRGLWVSVDGPDDWQEWSAGEQFVDLSKMIRHRVDLKPDANVLHISTPKGIDDFDRRFNTPTFYRGGNSIDWQAVAREFDGIVIAPYQWERRLDPLVFCYYSWDCASGCLWNPAAVASIRSRA